MRRGLFTSACSFRPTRPSALTTLRWPNGVLRPIAFVIPETTLLGAKAPRPVGGYTETILRLIGVIFGALGRVPRATRRTRTQELLALVGMDRWGDKRVTTYSKGMQQRIGIAAALINDPRLVVLDEPTDGVDPVGRREIRDMLLHLRSQGRSVLVNSHLLSEVEQVRGAQEFLE